jgi:hypothetical protein
MLQEQVCSERGTSEFVFSASASACSHSDCLSPPPIAQCSTAMHIVPVGSIVPIQHCMFLGHQQQLLCEYDRTLYVWVFRVCGAREICQVLLLIMKLIVFLHLL